MGILPHILLLGSLITTTIGTDNNDTRPLVNTKYGQLQGITVPVKETPRSIDAFFGVPFAKPPIGALRFANPEPPEPWSSVRDASEYPPICLQTPDFMNVVGEYYNSSFKEPRSSEDCLYLNVFTPSDRQNDSTLPVMVTASMIDGSALSTTENVVIVSIQYRLELLRYFRSSDDQLPGNYGLQDQVASLKWVQESISDFGGDPTSVTIFGDSAGANSVSALVLSPLAKGLFHRAIIVNGAATMQNFVVSKSEDLINYRNGMSPFSGTVDGVFLHKPPEEMLANKEGNKVPFIIGLNNHEFGWAAPMAYYYVLNHWRLFWYRHSSGFVLEQAYNVTEITKNMTRESVMSKLQNMPLLGLSPEVIPFAVEEYLGNTTDPIQIRDSFLDLCADILFRIPVLKLAHYHHDMGAPVYLYEFQNPTSLLVQGRPSFVKSDHSDELIFVFGGPFLRDGVIYAVNATQEEKLLSRTVMRYLANFARTGNPNSPGLTEWPEYGAEEHYLEINLKQKSSSKLMEDKYRFWTEILPGKIQSGAVNGSDHIEQ